MTRVKAHRRRGTKGVKEHSRAKFKVNDFVKIKSGRYRGITGRIFNIEKANNMRYYEIVTDDPWHSQGLGMVVDIPENNLKFLYR